MGVLDKILAANEIVAANTAISAQEALEKKRGDYRPQMSTPLWEEVLGKDKEKDKEEDKKNEANDLKLVPSPPKTEKPR